MLDLERQYDGPIPKKLLTTQPSQHSPEYGSWLLETLEASLADSVNEWQRQQYGYLIRQCKEKYKL